MKTAVRTQGGLLATGSNGAAAIAFAIAWASGVAYIITAKLMEFPAVWAMAGPLLIILTYAVIIGCSRYLRLRDDQAGDNLYYLGFLYTLTSLGVSLWQFSTTGGADVIVKNFGTAVSSTILGVALRVFFTQMRQDPIEVERSARLELAEAARRVRQELDATVFELSSFRRAMQQSTADSFVEIQKHIDTVSQATVELFRRLPEQSAAPLALVTRQTGEALDRLADMLTNGLERSATRLDNEAVRLGSVTGEMTRRLADLASQLKSMQMPDRVIEIKLQLTIDGLTKGIDALSSRLANQFERLQVAISSSSRAAAEQKRSADAIAVEQSKQLERIAVLLTSHENLIKQLSERALATQERSTMAGTFGDGGMPNITPWSAGPWGAQVPQEPRGGAAAARPSGTDARTVPNATDRPRKITTDAREGSGFSWPFLWPFLRR